MNEPEALAPTGLRHSCSRFLLSLPPMAPLRCCIFPGPTIVSRDYMGLLLYRKLQQLQKCGPSSAECMMGGASWIIRVGPHCHKTAHGRRDRRCPETLQETEKNSTEYCRRVEEGASSPGWQESTNAKKAGNQFLPP